MQAGLTMNPLDHADFYASDLFYNAILAIMRIFEQPTLLVACSLLVSTKPGKIQPQPTSGVQNASIISPASWPNPPLADGSNA